VNLLNVETNQKIPKLIWQTAKNVPHSNSHSLIKTWINKNPDYQWLFMDDIRCDKFIKDNFNNEFYNIYKSLPYGVMRADVWRVAVVYVYGGVYVDTDCECKVPINTWLSKDNELIVGVEVDNGALMNFAFASTAKNPALLSVLNQFVELYNKEWFMSKKFITPIQNFGQFGFSNGILRYFNLSDKHKMKLGGNTNYYNEQPEVVNSNTKFILQQNKQFTNGNYNSSYITHHVASLSWSNYNSWRKDERHYLNETD
jgi:mannosyltransferase OCH1-like enzyme